MKSILNTKHWSPEYYPPLLSTLIQEMVVKFRNGKHTRKLANIKPRPDMFSPRTGNLSAVAQERQNL